MNSPERVDAGADARFVRFTEARSSLDIRCRLLDAAAPVNADLLWELAGLDRRYPAIHAMWTGPEISVPIAGNDVLPSRNLGAVSTENATSYPRAGDIVLVCAPQGTWKEGPPFDLIDIGLFYAEGARLLMPMGWIMGSVCARIVDEDVANAAVACAAIRHNGACELHLSRCD